MTRASVFMASYNHAAFVRRAIQSVLDQSLTDFELIIVDDASTDASWSIIQEFADPRIRSFRNSTNRNDRRSVNEVFQAQAVGEYLAIHHSDNVWHPSKLLQQVTYLDAHPEAGAVFTNVRLISEDGGPSQAGARTGEGRFLQANRSRQEWLRTFFYEGNPLCHPTVLMRRSCFQECGPYRNGLALLTDLDLWIRVCMKWDIHVLAEPLVDNRLPTDLSNQSGDRPETRIRTQFEYLQALDGYRQIPSYDELLRVFPVAAQYGSPDGADLGYLLGRIALDAPARPAAFRLFGLQLLFDALGEPARAERIRSLYGFGARDLAALTGMHDVFSAESGARLGSELQSIRKSESWRLARALVHLGAILGGPRSPIRRLLRWLLREHPTD